MAKYKVDNKTRLGKRSYRKGRPDTIKDLTNAGMSRAEARVLSKLSSPVVDRMRRDRSAMYARFKNKANPDWSDNQLRYHWRKSVHRYYDRNSLWSPRSVGWTKKVKGKIVPNREVSVHEWYRAVERRMAKMAGLSVYAYRKLKTKTPPNKGNVRHQHLRATDRKNATRAGRGVAKPGTSGFAKYARKQIRGLTALQVAGDASQGTADRIAMYQGDLDRIRIGS